MQYYRIRFSTKDTGNKFPQVQTATGIFNVEDERYIGNIKYYLKPLDYCPILPELVLYKSTKLTDLVSVSFTGVQDGLVVSDRLRIILDKYINQRFQKFPIKIHFKNVEYDNYWYLRPSGFNNEFINFSESEVWEFNMLTKSKKVDITDKADFDRKMALTKYPYFLNILHYALKNEILPGFFTLRFIKGGIGFFGNENLRKEIEAAKMHRHCFLRVKSSLPLILLVFKVIQ